VEDDDEDEEDDDDDAEDEGSRRLVLDQWSVDKLLKSTTGFKPLVVRVEYVIQNPTGGMRFLLPDENQPKRSSHMYTYSGPFGGLCDRARTWMPCRDTLRNTCPLRLEITVSYWCVAVSSAQIVQQVIDRDGHFRSFQYVIMRRPIARPWASRSARSGCTCRRRCRA